jgi:hypothetical protein
MRDSYVEFINAGCISKEQFFEFGLSKTIYPSHDKAKKELTDFPRTSKTPYTALLKHFFITLK